MSKKESRSSGDASEPKPEGQAEEAASGSPAKRTTAVSVGRGSNGDDGDQITYVSLSQETRRRYLNYALSVITSRALPDVRDGLKPVQRRILYVMHHDLGLTATAKTRKSAKVCGDTTGSYHPHGEMAVYDSLVRMAQNFSLRYPLVIGQGNFGSVIGLPAAAARYTEVKLTAVAEQLMNELRFETINTARHMTPPNRNRSFFPRDFRICSSTARRGSPSGWRPIFRRTTCGKRSRPASS